MTIRSFFDPGVAEPQDDIAYLNFRKLTPNSVSVLAGHDNVKNQCYLTLVKRIKN